MPTWTSATTPKPKEVMSQGGEPSASGRSGPSGPSDFVSAAADKEESFGTPSAPEVAGTKKRLTSAKAMPPVTVTQPELPLLEQSESSQPVEAGAPLLGEAAAVAACHSGSW